MLNIPIQTIWNIQCIVYKAKLKRVYICTDKSMQYSFLLKKKKKKVIFISFPDSSSDFSFVLFLLICVNRKSLGLMRENKVIL